MLRYWSWLPAIAFLCLFGQALLPYAIGRTQITRGMGDEHTFYDDRHGYLWTYRNEVGSRHIWVSAIDRVDDDVVRRPVYAIIEQCAIEMQRTVGFADHSAVFRGTGFPFPWYYSARLSADNRRVREADRNDGAGAAAWPRNGDWKRGVSLDYAMFGLNALIMLLFVIFLCMIYECSVQNRVLRIETPTP